MVLFFFIFCVLRALYVVFKYCVHVGIGHFFFFVVIMKHEREKNLYEKKFILKFDCVLGCLVMRS